MDYNYPMTYRHFKFEGVLYILAFLLALALRLTKLGVMPLTDLEATSALQALHITQGLKTALSPHPLYILSTAVLFFLYGGGTNFLARLIPALVGSTLVFAPLLLNRIKPRPGLILAFIIALDPGLTTISRQVASPILAITFLIFAGGFFSKNKTSFAGVFAALAALSGPSVWTGLLSLGITWALMQGINSRRVASESEDPKINIRQSVREAALPFITTFIAVGTLFFTVPNGISAALASIPAFIDTWLFPSGVPASRLFLSLPVYQPLTLLLALLAIIRGWRKGSPRIIPLSVWLLVSLLLAVFAPSRQVTDLAWMLIPLGALAALELARNVDIFPEERSEIAGVVVLTAFLWVFAWINFSGMIWHPQESREYGIGFWILIGVVLLIVLSLLLVAAGWSKRTARLGGIWGLALGLGALGLAGTLGSAGLRGLNNPEMWWLPEKPTQANLLEATISDISEWGVGNDNAAPVVITGLDSPALEWALREHHVIIAKTLDISSSPDFVITPFETDPVLVSAYRGQDFSWRETPLWENALPTDWIRWVTLREMTQSNETIILWARDDLFLDTSATP
jgi:hypothetical protein